MKKFVCVVMVVMMLTAIYPASFADNYTIYYKNLSGGINGKQNTDKVTKGASGSAINDVNMLSRSLTFDDPVVAKIRYGANGNPVSDASNIRLEITYTMAYKYYEKGIVGKTYYLKMQNTTGSDDVKISGRFTP